MHRSMIASCLSTTGSLAALAEIFRATAVESPLLRLDPNERKSPTQVPPGDLSDAVGPVPEPFGEDDDDFESEDEEDED